MPEKVFKNRNRRDARLRAMAGTEVPKPRIQQDLSRRIGPATIMKAVFDGTTMNFESLAPRR